jgi:ribosomal protein S12 methylthiotransferase
VDQGRRGLPSLIKRILSSADLQWLRLLYLHPDGLDEELQELLATEKRLCPYLDLPLQHASPKILARMRRSYDPEEILRLMERLRREIPEIAFRTSVMVGFPGETEEDFSLLLDFLAAAEFDHLGAFIFSPEEGTLAAKMDQQLSEEEKRIRFEEVMLLQQDISARKLASRLGKETRVLIEGWDEEGRLYGHACFQAPEIDGQVFLEGEAEPGEIVSVVPVEADVYDLRARIKPAGQQ